VGERLIDGEEGDEFFPQDQVADAEASEVIT
jgi:hypothetical protein